MPVIPALKRLRQEDDKFLGYLARLYLKKKNKKEKVPAFSKQGVN
jgi:hypothetical protein